VLVSWGVPKGLPLDGERSHLAIRVKDHPVESARILGELPTRRWGTGAARVWDSGTFETQKWSEHEIQVVLHGGVVEATYVLVHVDGDHWLVQHVAS
jgi:bifunctional non-homologous end joining protein LigD